MAGGLAAGTQYAGAGFADGLPKRQQLAAEDDLDDEELLALAFSQPWPPPAPVRQQSSQAVPAKQLPDTAQVDSAEASGSDQYDFDNGAMAADMDSEAPGSRPLATSDEVAQYLQQLQIHHDPLAVEGPIMQATAANGMPVYCLVTEPAAPQPRMPSARGQLLSRPISQLLAEVEQESFDKALAESRAMSTQAAKQRQQQQYTRQQLQQQQQGDGQALWVDKYRPEGFMELLSNEQVNRDVLDWVKAWDTTVFGHGSAKPVSSVKGQQPPISSSEMTVDQKLLLLSGPPGQHQPIANILTLAAGGHCCFARPQKVFHEAFHEILSSARSCLQSHHMLKTRMDTASMPCMRVLHELEHPNHDLGLDKLFRAAIDTRGAVLAQMILPRNFFSACPCPAFLAMTQAQAYKETAGNTALRRVTLNLHAGCKSKRCSKCLHLGLVMLQDLAKQPWRTQLLSTVATAHMRSMPAMTGQAKPCSTRSRMLLIPNLPLAVGSQTWSSLMRWTALQVISRDRLADHLHSPQACHI